MHVFCSPPGATAPVRSGTSAVLERYERADDRRRGEIAMPALAWVAFWSWMMGAAACWGEAPISVPVKKDVDRRDRPNG